MSANGVGNADGGDPEVESRLRENAVTMNKMSDLRAQMEKLNVARRQKKSKVEMQSLYIGYCDYHLVTCISDIATISPIPKANFSTAAVLRCDYLLVY